MVETRNNNRSYLLNFSFGGLKKNLDHPSLDTLHAQIWNSIIADSDNICISKATVTSYVTM